MKVLIVYPEKNPNDNPFIRTFMKGLRDIGCDMNWGRNEFWKNYAQYDIIHIHWPDAMFERMPPTDADIIVLETHLKEIKKSVKILYTRHNKTPHYSQNPNRLACYELIQQYADGIVHLGHSGFEEYKRQLNNDRIRHYFIPHHTYDQMYDNTIPKKDAREKLMIPQEKFVVLTFGDYRDMEEANMVLSEFQKLQLKNKTLLAPRLASIMTKDLQNKFRLKGAISKFVSFRLKQKKVLAGSEYINDEFLAYYFRAADVVLIQRKHILNSGNVPLAFFFKRPVIGADVGNVGELLRLTNNIVFNPEQKGSLCEAMYKAKEIADSETGQNNYEYAHRNMRIEIVAQQYFDVYKNL